MKDTWTDLKGLKVTVMGLGLNGGGVATAAFLAQRGADVTVTDMKTEAELQTSVQALAAWPGIRFVLGRHEIEDFSGADLVIKNPGVRKSNPFLQAAKRVETDISIFLQCVTGPVLAVTGSKGKSTTVSALHHILKRRWPQTRLGGNITLSPLTFVSELDGESPIVLELSSWQLGDLKGRDILKPRISAITNIFHDHMNSYDTLEDYARDKLEIARHQGPDDWMIVNRDEAFSQLFQDGTSARVFPLSPSGNAQVLMEPYAAWMEGLQGLMRYQGITENLLPEKLLVPGRAFRVNALTAGIMARLMGVPATDIAQALSTFPGVEHRLEHFLTWKGVTFINDTTATIPEAAAASYQCLEGPLLWIAGGSDKNLDLTSFEKLTTPPKALFLLAGTATDRWIPILKGKGWGFQGPFTVLGDLLEEVFKTAQPGDQVLLSPGATSLQHFANEFDRGRQFKDFCLQRTKGTVP